LAEKEEKYEGSLHDLKNRSKQVERSNTSPVSIPSESRRNLRFASETLFTYFTKPLKTLCASAPAAAHLCDGKAVLPPHPSLAATIEG